MTGILAIDKPIEWTSHDVVARVRRVSGQRQVGHAGTLDPLATGVLLLMLGHATKLSSYLMSGVKEYSAEIVLGASTATDDAEAPLEQLADATHVTEAEIRASLESFVGEIQQIPPAYAAIRHQGEKLYRLARAGKTVRPQARTVRIHRIEMVSWHPPRLCLVVRCEAGTYIRALARDIGATLGVGGYLHALCRTQSGRIGIDMCIPLDALSDIPAIELALLPADHAVLDLPALVLSVEEAEGVRQGRPVHVPAGDFAGQVRLYEESGVLLGMGSRDGDWVKPSRVFKDNAHHS
jgi:tRNA pseudouridine55 synthase